MNESVRLLRSQGRGMPLKRALTELLEEADQMDVTVAFVTEDGAITLIEALGNASIDPRDVLLITGTDFSATHPAALRLLYGAGVRVFKYNGTATFHPKLYWFRSAQTCDLLLGSANLTGSAFSTNVEAMLHVRTSSKSKLARDVQKTLTDIRRSSIAWTSSRIESYAEDWRPPRPKGKKEKRTVSEYLTEKQIYRKLPRRLVFRNHHFVFTGYFQSGTTHPQCEERTRRAGGLTGSGKVNHQTHYLVVGAYGNPNYVRKTYGRKIELAVRYREQTGWPLILTEGDWSSRVRSTL